MNRTRVERRLPYRPDDLLNMVADVEAYPKFVPWVRSMRVSNRTDTDCGAAFDAEAAVAFAIVRERFATHVVKDEVEKRITVELISGPFKHLSNSWWFRSDPAGTLVEFEIEFAFKSRLLDGLLAMNARRAADLIIQCFEGRARKLYGKAASGDVPVTA